MGFVADTHVGPIISAQDVGRALSLLHPANPEILLLGGDYLCDSPRFINEAAAVLGDFASSVRYGAVAVLGNHDYSNDGCRVAAELERRGIRVLRNESTRVMTDAGDLWIAGIDDAILGAPDPNRTFAQIPENAAVVALWHEPDWAEEAGARGALLQLSGHSHGGQIRIPLIGNIAAPPGGRRYFAGLNAAVGMPVYTSRGVGIYRPPVRLRCPPEVTLVTLL
ncbi:MAG: metallophosphoesterase [Chloroflexia bacterium]|nr:metallophosphoesterase [Chloroflexia bacterium]